MYKNILYQSGIFVLINSDQSNSRIKTWINIKCLFHGILHLHVSPQMCKQLCLEREYRRRCRCYALFAQEHNDTKNDLGGVDIRCSLFNTTQSESIRPSVTAYQSPSRGCLHIRRFCGLLSVHCRITSQVFVIVWIFYSHHKVRTCHLYHLYEV